MFAAKSNLSRLSSIQATLSRYRKRQPPFLLFLTSLLVASATLLPLAYLLLRASNVGWERVNKFVMRPHTLEILRNSVQLALSVTVAAVIIGVLLAWLTTRTDLPGRKLWTVLTVLPLVIPSYVGAFTLVSALSPKGLLQSWLEPLGIERLPSIYGFWGAFLVMTIFTYPYVLLSVRAAFYGLDSSLEEAARGLGRNRWQLFLEITLPHLRPAVAAGGLLVALYTLSDFGAVSMLRFNTFTRAIYLQYTASFDRSVAAIFALQLVILTLLILFLEKRMRGKAKYYRSSSGTIRPPTPIKLGRWRIPALLFCTLIVMLGVIIPLGVIIFWLTRGVAAGELVEFQLMTVYNSVLASGLAALVAVVAALPVTILAIRYPSLISQWLERITYIGYGLPGVVIALSLVFFGANYATFLYQTLAMLVFAYIVRFLPQAVGSTRASMLQVSPRLEEAARNLGRTPAQVLTSITIPLVRPGLMMGMALVFLTGMKELPATLLLGPTGYDTLATRIWGATEEAFFARASLPALLLVLVSAIAVWIILSKEERYVN